MNSSPHRLSRSLSTAALLAALALALGDRTTGQGLATAAPADPTTSFNPPTSSQPDHANQPTTPDTRPRHPDVLAMPIDMRCGNFENVTNKVNVVFNDQSTDETDYRIEKQVDGGAWGEIATVTADATLYSTCAMAVGCNGVYADNIDASKANRYRVRAHKSSDNTFGAYSNVCRAPLTFDSTDFRLYFRPFPAADCPMVAGNVVCVSNATNGAGDNEIAARMTSLLQGSRTAFMAVGFDDPAFFNNAKRMPIDLTWCDGGGCAGADGWGNGRKGGIGLAPTLLGSWDAATSTGDPTSVLVTEHELFHQQQYTYGGLHTDPDGNWVWEAQARSTQDKFCVGTVRATCVSLDAVPGGSYNYVGEVNAYLSNANRSLVNLSYTAALFWTYVTERYGTLVQEPERGADLLVRFWEAARAQRDDDGIGTLNRTLANMGYTQRFRDIFKDFAVANYAKDLTGPSVPAKYKYIDESQPPGSYISVTLDVNVPLGPADQVGPTTTDIVAWGARYYQVRPAADVPILSIEFRQDTSNTLYYTLLAIKNNDIVTEVNYTGEDFVQTLANAAYDKVVVIVVGLDNYANYRYAFNAVKPVLNIIDPLQARPAQAGDPAAPEKILVKFEVLSPLGGGTPVVGIDTDAVTITIGTQNVPAAGGARISSAYIQGQYWILLRAPTQTAAGDYNLKVDYTASLSDTEVNAVHYAPRADADNAIVIDRSGSMGDFNKMQSAKDAGRLYVDSWRAGDKIGVVSFSDDAIADLTLRDWDATSRDDAFTKINLLSPGGGTAIGDGLIKGQQELVDHGNTAHTWAIVLLSDGMETSDERVPKFLTAYNTRKNAGQKVPQVHAVALGPDADRTAMQNVASATGGTYQYAGEPAGPFAAGASGRTSSGRNLSGGSSTSGRTAPAADRAEGSGSANDREASPGRAASPAGLDAVNLPLDLAEIYRVIGETVALQQQIYSARGDLIFKPLDAQSASQPQLVDAFDAAHSPLTDALPAQQPPRDVHNITVDGGASEAIFVLKWDSIYQGPKSTLRDPMGTDMGPPTLEQSGHRVWRVPAPIAGVWTMTMEGVPGQEFTASTWLVEAALKSRLTLDAFLGLAPADRIAGRALPILVSLSDNQVIKGATVDVHITNPADTVYSLHLFDDGLHGDGAAGDGFYGNVFLNTFVPGSYVAVIDASGTSTLGGPFVRRLRLSFDELAGPDSDKDGLPDWWETEHGTDPNNGQDSRDDPDNDGLTNGQEYQYGTDPFDPDTDDGGVTDGAEVQRKTDPLDPRDDRMQPPRIKAWPGVGRVLIRFTMPPEFEQVRIYRSDSPKGPFKILSNQSKQRHDFEDRQVENGKLYCYRVDALGLENLVSAPSNISCATPKLDPNPPTGGIRINDGWPTTSSQDVQLNLWATDIPSPETESPGSPPTPDPSPPSGVKDMLLSNSGNFNGAAWEPFAPTKPWHLPLNGINTVFVKYRDAAGNESEVFHATVKIVASLYIDPAHGTLGVGDTFTVEVKIANVQRLYGVQLELAFDRNVLEVLDADDATPGVQVVPGDFLMPDVELRNVGSNTRGAVEYAATLQGEKPGVSGGGTLAKIGFRGKMAGTSPISFTRGLLSDPQSGPIDAEQHGGVLDVRIVNPNDVPFNVRGKVILERRNTGNAGARACGGPGACATTDAAGNYALTGVKVGDSISITHPSYLATTRLLTAPPATPGGTLTLPDVTLLGGDVDQSGRIYAADAIEIAKSWNAAMGATRYLSRLDVTDDKMINLLDMVAVQFNFGKTVPGPWPGMADLSAWRGSTSDTLGTRWLGESGGLAGLIALDDGNPRAQSSALGNGNLATQLQAARPDQDTTVRILPATTTLPGLGVGAAVNIRVENVQKLFGFNVKLKFDPTILRVKDANPNLAGVQILPGEFLDVENLIIVHNSVDNAAGEIQLVMTETYPAGGRDGSGVLGTIRFEGLKAGESAVELTELELFDDSFPGAETIGAKGIGGTVKVKTAKFLNYAPFLAQKYVRR